MVGAYNHCFCLHYYIWVTMHALHCLHAWSFWVHSLIDRPPKEIKRVVVVTFPLWSMDRAWMQFRISDDRWTTHATHHGVGIGMERLIARNYTNWTGKSLHALHCKAHIYPCYCCTAAHHQHHKSLLRMNSISCRSVSWSDRSFT